MRPVVIRSAVRALSAFAMALAVTACGTIHPKNQAEFTSYGYVTDFKNVTNAQCKYGRYTFGNVGITDGTVFKNLTCTWKSLDGTPRSESVDMQALLAKKIVEWDFTDVEVFTERPLQMSPDIRVELRDKLFRITVQARVSTIGGPTPTGGNYLPVRVITNTLLERTGE